MMHATPTLTTEALVSMNSETTTNDNKQTKSLRPLQKPLQGPLLYSTVL